MGLTKYKLGELIELVLDENTDLRYGPDDVMGMTITKEIIPTKANMQGTDLSRFLVVGPNEFIFNPRTHGKKIGFGYNNSNKSFIISWNNIAFRIKKDFIDIVTPGYLFLHFNRSEWDREACFRSWGTSTEVFSWNALCEMELVLPPIDIQKKYVAIYNSLLANQKSYERGLDDLKLAYEVIIDGFKHKASKMSIGDILRESDKRNIDNIISDVQGINTGKNFMPTVADTNGVKLSNYKVVSKGQFAFSGMQTGRDECIRIALYDKDNTIIISPAYSVLNNKRDDILSEYVMMWFSRKEIDRLGCFMSDASIRTNLDMDRFYEIMIPVPKMKEQQAVVEIYNIFQLRLSINKRLKDQIKEICPILIKGSIEEAQR